MTEQQILDLLKKLIEIPSINPNFSEGMSEMNIALYIHDWLIQHGIKAQIEEVRPGRPNIFAEIGNGKGPTLCLCAHLDTVGDNPSFSTKL